MIVYTDCSVHDCCVPWDNTVIENQFLDTDRVVMQWRICGGDKGSTEGPFLATYHNTQVNMTIAMSCPQAFKSGRRWKAWYTPHVHAQS